MTILTDDGWWRHSWWCLPLAVILYIYNHKGRMEPVPSLVL